MVFLLSSNLRQFWFFFFFGFGSLQFKRILVYFSSGVFGRKLLHEVGDDTAYTILFDVIFGTFGTNLHAWISTI
jgi:hypothetical protein